MVKIEGYDWAQNRDKLGRAIEELKEKSAEITDKSVKAVYKRLLGFVIGEDEGKKIKELEGLTSKELYKLAEKKEKEEKGKAEAEEEEEEDKPKGKGKGKGKK